MNRSGHRHELTYSLIQRAIHGDPEALGEILLYYDAYINALVTYETTGPDGRTYRLVDEDMKAEVQMKLLDAIQHHWREMI